MTDDVRLTNRKFYTEVKDSGVPVDMLDCSGIEIILMDLESEQSKLEEMWSSRKMKLDLALQLRIFEREVMEVRVQAGGRSSFFDPRVLGSSDDKDDDDDEYGCGNDNGIELLIDDDDDCDVDDEDDLDHGIRKWRFWWQRWKMIMIMMMIMMMILLEAIEAAGHVAQGVYQVGPWSWRGSGREEPPNPQRHRPAHAEQHLWGLPDGTGSFSGDDDDDDDGGNDDNIELPIMMIMVVMMMMVRYIYKIYEA